MPVKMFVVTDTYRNTKRRLFFNEENADQCVDYLNAEYASSDYVFKDVIFSVDNPPDKIEVLTVEEIKNSEL